MASKYAPKKSMRPRSRNDAKGMSPKELEGSTSGPGGLSMEEKTDAVKKMYDRNRGNIRGNMKKVKKMKDGGKMCRGMGAATRGGNFRMG